MIKLELKEYCKDCIYFDEDVQRPAKLTFRHFKEGDREEYLGDVIIRCAHRNICERINYINKEDSK